MAFDNRVNYHDLNRVVINDLENEIAPEDRGRVQRIREYWDFYEGYHWEGVPNGDKPQITENYCRKFVDKFVSFELGMGFTVEVPFEQDDENSVVTPINDFLEEMWNDNYRDTFCIELGQSKGVTGDGWAQVRFEPPNPNDPFQEYPDGRVRIMVIPTNIVFPIYDEHDKDKLNQVTIAYPIERYDQSPILRKKSKTKLIYKQIWTTERIEVWEGKEKVSELPNPYKVIPFVQIKNVPLVGRANGISDLEDIIPLNMEMNLKKSDISEIIDYHSAPVTILYGARVSSLEKGANKVWGGLPKDARVENLQLNSDLGASVSYISGLKTALHEVGGIPEGALGGSQSISNTSGVALQFVNMPLIERTRIKRMETTKGIQKINKLALLIAVKEKLITIPEGVTNKEFYTTKVQFPDTLPKDRLLELQQIQLEMQMGLESRMGAMRRLNKDNPTQLIEEIEAERLQEEQRMLESQMRQVEVNLVNQIKSVEMQKKTEMGNATPKINSGHTNGQTPIEQVRTEITGSNGASKEV